MSGDASQFMRFLRAEWPRFAYEVVAELHCPADEQPRYAAINAYAARYVRERGIPPRLWGSPRVRAALKQNIIEHYQQGLGGPGGWRLEELRPSAAAEVMCHCGRCPASNLMDVQAELLAHLSEVDEKPENWGRSDVEAVMLDVDYWASRTHYMMTRQERLQAFERVGFYEQVVAYLKAVGAEEDWPRSCVFDDGARFADEFNDNIAKFTSDDWWYLACRVAHFQYAFRPCTPLKAKALALVEAFFSGHPEAHASAVQQLVDGGFLPSPTLEEGPLAAPDSVGNDLPVFLVPNDKPLVDKMALLLVQRLAHEDGEPSVDEIRVVSQRAVDELMSIYQRDRVINKK